MTPEQQKRADEYREKVREERTRKKHMTTEEFYEQMARSMGMKLKFINQKEESHTQVNMEKTIEDYQKEIKSLKNELECYKNNNDIQSDVLKRQWDILDKILFELPVGSITQHTYENIPDRVKYFVREYAILEQEKDAVDELIAKTMPNFFDNPKAGSILDNVTILIEMANKAMLDAWADREALEALQAEIETFYEYYAGFGAKKDLTTTQMLNHILQSVPNYKPTKEEYALEDMKRHCDHYINALEEIIKKNRKAETCRMIALKALGELNDEDHQPELLIEENLKLKIQVEDLESQIANAVLDKVFPKESHPLMHCKDCGEYWGYHHEEHCKARKPKPTLNDIKPPHTSYYP